MFDGFFPTPGEVVERMIEGLKIGDQTVLDPSAGKGDILSRILDKGPYYNRSPNNLYAIEIDPGLRAILVEAGFRVVGTDFFQYPGLQHFGFIIMNPPFDQGVAHLLKAFEISNGAVIRCLLNTESINNPYTSERMRLKKIIEQFGWVEELGPVFRHAERPTDVSVSLIHLEDTRQKEEFLSDFEPATMDGGDFSLDDMVENSLALANVFESYEARFRATIEAFKELLIATAKVKHYLEPLTTDYPSPDKLIEQALKAEHGPLLRYETFLESATKTAWDHLFSKTKLAAVTTEGVRKEIEQMQSSQGQMAFTATNMEDLFQQLFLSRHEIMLGCLVDAFENITKYYDGNREYVEGWKTNSSYMVQRKFIMPNMLSAYSPDSGLDYSAQGVISDIEKALSFLANRPFENITSVTTVYAHESFFGELKESTYFSTRLYRKGTIHMTFKNEDLRMRFNAAVAQKLWGLRVPEKTKSGVYK